MYVRLNLATNPLVSQRRFLVGSAALAGIGLLLLLVLGLRVYKLRSAAQDLRARSSKIQKETAVVEQQRRDLERYFQERESAGMREQAKFVVGVLQERSINWTQMFMDLEHTLPPGVHVIRVEPKLEKGIVKVHFVVGAANQDAKLKLLKAFESAKSFSHVELVTEKVSVQPGSDPLSVELTVVYSNV
jgi:Tfp pilus assembly protein PilN